jgi:hypothetical protein
VCVCARACVCVCVYALTSVEDACASGAADAGLPGHPALRPIRLAQEDGVGGVGVARGHDALLLHLRPRHEHL